MRPKPHGGYPHRISTSYILAIWSQSCSRRIAASGLPVAAPGALPTDYGSNIAASTAASAPGWTPPAQTGGPSYVGLNPGLAQGIGGWITGAETTAGGWVSNIEQAVGSAFKNAFGGLLASIENWVGRGFLIFVGIVLLALALWRLMDPSGEKTQAAVKMAAA